MQIDTFITDRLDDQIKYFSDAASREQGRGKQWQNALIGAAAATPALIAMAELVGTGFWEDLFRAGALISSAVAAVATSILSTRKYWENGVTYRAREQALIREKILYETRTGPYADGASDMAPDQLLIETVEGLIAEDVAGWTERMIDASQRARAKKAAKGKDAKAAPAPAAPAPAAAPPPKP